jgi:hypothetical protein
MAGDDLTPSENATLIVLMAEAREVLNTDLKKLYGLDVTKKSRDKFARRRYVSSRKSGPTFALQLDDDGWAQVQNELEFRSRGATAHAAALTALLASLRDRVLDRSGCKSYAELFALNDLRGPHSAGDQEQILRTRIVNAYESLAAEPGGWVSLTRLRPFFGDVPRAAVDEALRKLSREPGVNIVPASNQKMLTEADAAAALHLGGQEKHSLAIGV